MRLSWMDHIGLLLACGLKRGVRKQVLREWYTGKSLLRLPSAPLVVDQLRLTESRIAALHKMLRFEIRANDLNSPASLPTLHPVAAHINAFPMHLRLMLNNSFPLPLMGLVHVANRIVQHAPITGGQGFRQTCRFGESRHTLQGWEFDILCDTEEGGNIVQRSVSTYLYKVPKTWRSDELHQQAVPSTVFTDYITRDTWLLGKDTGRKYARVSGDHNPIHVSGTLARMFGFKAAIAHGMFCKGRLLSLYYPARTHAFDIELMFRKPVLLPRKVSVCELRDEQGIRVNLSSGDDCNKPTLHLQGQLNVD